MEITLTKENFSAEVLKSPMPVLVDFWAGWCQPCHAIAPAVAEIARSFKDRLKVGKLNVDDNPEVASTHQVRSIPNLKLFKNSRVVEEIIGAVSKAEIVKRIEKHLS